MFRAADRPTTRWQNGLGVTHEIVRWPRTSGFDDLTWRVAIAELADDAAFSVLPGVDRHLALLDGAPVELTVVGSAQTLVRHVPVAFPGDVPAAARLLAGPATDLNVMTRRGVACATLAIQRPSGPCEVTPNQPGGAVLVVVVEGWARVRVSRRGREDLGPLDALLVRRRVVVHPGPDEIAPVIALVWLAATPGGS